MHTNTVFGVAKGVLFIKVSSFKGMSLLSGSTVTCVYMFCTCVYCIRESVDSLCRGDADMPMPPYIRKA